MMPDYVMPYVGRPQAYYNICLVFPPLLLVGKYMMPEYVMPYVGRLGAAVYAFFYFFFFYSLDYMMPDVSRQ